MGKIYEVLKKAEAERQFQPKELKSPERVIYPKQQVPKKFIGTPTMIEECHRMQLMIQAIVNEAHKTIVFSSALQGEGTSTIAINFAKTVAATEATALLIDANLRRPALHQILNVELNWGLSDLFQGKSSVSDVIKKTKIPNLSVITCGSPNYPKPLAMFLEDSIDAFMKEIKQHAEWVLFDTPPLNSYNDAIPVAAKADGVVLVVEAEKTRWEVAQKACRQLEEGGIRVLGAVLNRRKMHIPDWLYNRL
jgi:capsular exopolysaccharide synthesis family protein